MIIKDFSEFELDYFRKYCHFVGDEKELFELRSEGIPIEQIAEILNLSVDGAKKISQKVNKKIIKVI